ncbi:cytochrome P450 [Aspergillus aurantiobrunneus]
MAYIDTFSPTQAIVVLAVVLLLTKIYRVYTGPLAQLPGPAISKWTGLVLQKHLFAGDRPRYVQQLHQKYGPIVRISPTELDVSVSAAAKSIHKVASRFYKGRFYEHIGHRSPKTLFSSTDPQFHAYRRRLLGGPMSETSIRQHEPTVAEKVKLCVDQMAKEAERRGCIDVFKWWCFLATDTIGELSFGESFRMLEKGEKSQYSLDLEMASTLMIIRTTFPFLSRVAEYVPLPYFKQAAQSGKRMGGYAAEYIHRYKKLVETYGEDVKPTLFSKLITKGHDEGTLTEAEIRLEAGGYIVAGSDTSAISLTYLVWAVCKDARIRDTLVAEVATLPDDFTDDQVRALPYTRRVIDETLRLYPAVPGALPRVVPPEGAQLLDYFVPGGTTVSTQVYSLHRDPEIFPNPDSFDPDRWISPTKEMKDSLMPFGGGSRSCIGMHLARMELRLATAHFFRRFTIPKVSRKEGFTDDDMHQHMYFLVSPRGHRCLIEIGHGG